LLPSFAEVVDVSQRLRAEVFEHVVEAGLAGVEEVASPMDAGKGEVPVSSSARAFEPAHLLPKQAKKQSN
jgi:hypothetical protein